MSKKYRKGNRKVRHKYKFLKKQWSKIVSLKEIKIWKKRKKLKECQKNNTDDSKVKTEVMSEEDFTNKQNYMEGKQERESNE